MRSPGARDVSVGRVCGQRKRSEVKTGRAGAVPSHEEKVGGAGYRTLDRQTSLEKRQLWTRSSGSPLSPLPHRVLALSTVLAHWLRQFGNVHTLFLFIFVLQLLPPNVNTPSSLDWGGSLEDSGSERNLQKAELRDLCKPLLPRYYISSNGCC